MAEIYNIYLFNEVKYGRKKMKLAIYSVVIRKKIVYITSFAWKYDLIGMTKKKIKIAIQDNCCIRECDTIGEMKVIG